MSDMRFKFVLSNGGTISYDGQAEELPGMVTVVKNDGMIGTLGALINARHIVAIEFESINHV